MCGPWYYRCAHVPKRSQEFAIANLTSGTVHKLCESCVRSLKNGEEVTVIRGTQTRKINIQEIHHFHSRVSKMRGATDYWGTYEDYIRSTEWERRMK